MTYYASDNPNGFVTGKRFEIDVPCVSIMAAGMGGDSYGHWYFADDGGGAVKRKDENKPAYRVPLMSEISALPWNGFNVVSTFSGCGGSCLGYRMAGFKVLWANEFVPAVQESYKANAAPDCILDCRDIRAVQPEEILQATGLAEGEFDLFDGSPPCQAFSIAGKREKGWGKEKTYEHGASQYNETLFDEYIRLLRGLKPKVFVAENVSGLVKGVAKGYFLEILAALKESGYHVTCRILDAQWLGVPQRRQRVIFIGVRNNLGKEPVHPKPLPYRYSVRDALPWIGKSVNDPHKQFKAQENNDDKLHCAITLANKGHIKVESLPPSRLKEGAYGVQVIDPEKPYPTVTIGSPGNDFVLIAEHETNISGYAIGDEWDKLKSGEQSSKYFSLHKASENDPSPTIQASHGNLSMAGVVHPIEKRKFTIDELKRICAFPDDFILKGSYAQQWSCLGNSVPPVMMRYISETIRDKVLQVTS